MAFFRDEGKLRSEDVRWALESFNCGIKDYFEDAFGQFHSNLYNNVVSLRGVCCQNCSKRKPVTDWCSLCSKWRDAILTKHRFRNTCSVIWKSIDSSKWPSDVKEVQKVFLPSWYKGKLETTDLSTCLNIMINCTLFGNRHELMKIRDIRNTISHGRMSLNETEKQKYIGKILSYLKKDTLKSFSSVKKSIKHVDILKNQSVKDIYENNLIEEIERNKIEKLLYKRTSSLHRNVTCSVFMILSVVLLAYVITQWKRDNGVSIDHPWSLGQPSSFVTSHDDFLGRVRLKERIHEKLKQSTSGVILVAGMGYGKSALIADFIRTYHNVNLPLLGYHICQYDSRSPFGISTFILNLYQSLQNRYKEFVNSLPPKLRYNKEINPFCTLNSFQCFQELIISPLKAANISERSLFMIDAIDECDDSSLILQTMSVPELIFKHYRVFAPFATFFMTSRNNSALLSHFRTFEQIHVDQYDQENKNDMKLYLQQKTSCNESYINQIVSKSRNTFLILKYYISNINDKCDIPADQESTTIFEIYDFEFSRRYGNEFSRKYRIDKSFFEVLCSKYSEDAISVRKMRNIMMHSSPAPDDDEFDEMLHRVNPTFVRIYDDNDIYLFHSSLIEWLKSDGNVKFKVNIQRGHYIWTNYLYNKLKVKSTAPINITDCQSIFQPYSMALHIILANNESLQKELISGKFKVPDLEISCVSCWKYISRFVAFQYRTLSHIQLAVELLDNYRMIKTLTLMSDTLNVTNEVIVALMLNRNDSLTALLETGVIDLKQRETIIDGWMTFGRDLNLDLHEDIRRGSILGKTPESIKLLLNIAGNFALDSVNVFHLFMQNGPLERVENLLMKDLSILDEKTGNGWDAYDFAVSFDAITMFDLFQTVKPNNRSAWYLWYASVQGSYHIVDSLLEQGVMDECVKCSLSKVDESKRIFEAFLRNSTLANVFSISEIYKFRRRFTCESSLSVAVKRGHDAVVRALLMSSLKCLEHKDAFGFTPLAAAIFHKQESIAGLLLRFGASPSFVIKPLLSSKKIEFFNAALRFPLEKNWTTKNAYNGATIYHLSCLRPTCFTTIFIRNILQNHLMMSIPIDLDLRDSQGRTPLYYAICHPEADNFHASLYDLFYPKSHNMVFVLIEALSSHKIPDLPMQLGICGKEMAHFSILKVKSQHREMFCKQKSNFPNIKDFTVISSPIAWNNITHSGFVIAAVDDMSNGGTYFAFVRESTKNLTLNHIERNTFKNSPKEDILMYIKGFKYNGTESTVHIET